MKIDKKKDCAHTDMNGHVALREAVIHKQTDANTP